MDPILTSLEVSALPGAVENGSETRKARRRSGVGTSGNLGFETRSRSKGLENPSELVGFMRIAEDLATTRSAEAEVSAIA